MALFIGGIFSAMLTGAHFDRLRSSPDAREGAAVERFSFSPSPRGAGDVESDRFTTPRSSEIDSYERLPAVLRAPGWEADTSDKNVADSYIRYRSLGSNARPERITLRLEEIGDQHYLDLLLGPKQAINTVLRIEVGGLHSLAEFPSGERVELERVKAPTFPCQITIDIGDTMVTVRGASETYLRFAHRTPDLSEVSLATNLDDRSLKELKIVEGAVAP